MDSAPVISWRNRWRKADLLPPVSPGPAPHMMPAFCRLSQAPLWRSPRRPCIDARRSGFWLSQSAYRQPELAWHPTSPPSSTPLQSNCEPDRSHRAVLLLVVGRATSADPYQCDPNRPAPFPSTPVPACRPSSGFEPACDGCFHDWLPEWLQKRRSIPWRWHLFDRPEVGLA